MSSCEVSPHISCPCTAQRSISMYIYISAIIKLISQLFSYVIHNYPIRLIESFDSGKIFKLLVVWIRLSLMQYKTVDEKIQLGGPLWVGADRLQVAKGFENAVLYLRGRISLLYRLTCLMKRPMTKKCYCIITRLPPVKITAGLLTCWGLNLRKSFLYPLRQLRRSWSVAFTHVLPYIRTKIFCCLPSFKLNTRTQTQIFFTSCWKNAVSRDSPIYLHQLWRSVLHDRNVNSCCRIRPPPPAY